MLVKIGYSREFAVFEDGIYYMGPTVKNATPLYYFNLATGVSQQLTIIEGLVRYGFCVSPDRKTMLYTKWLDTGADLMLIENFR